MKKIVGLVFAVLFAGNVSAGGDAAKGKDASAMCAACHGPDGNAAIAGNPKLAGQAEKYLVKQLVEFKSQARQNAIMQPMAAGLSDQAMQDIAAYYAAQTVQHAAVEDKYIAAGLQLYRSGDADRNIPACMACHGASGEGMPAAGFPALAGQAPDYTKAQLMAFRSGARNNDVNSVMRDITAKMSDEQIEVLAYFLAGLH